MVSDPTTDYLIRWSPEGKSFLVQDHETFAKTVLPKFYRHNTFASFVRQLNMYDFHKIPHIKQGVLANESTMVDGELWEFNNSYFQRDREDLLVMVTHKKNRDRDEITSDRMSLKTLLTEMATMKSQQDSLISDLEELRSYNDVIWQEALEAREKCQRQQQIISKILQFLSLVFSNDHSIIYASQNQRRQQYNCFTDSNKESSTTTSSKSSEGANIASTPPRKQQHRNIRDETRQFYFDNQMPYYLNSILTTYQDIDELERNLEELITRFDTNQSILEDTNDFESQLKQNCNPFHNTISKADYAYSNKATDTNELLNKHNNLQQGTANSSNWYFEQLVKEVDSFPKKIISTGSDLSRTIQTTVTNPQITNSVTCTDSSIEDFVNRQKNPEQNIQPFSQNYDTNATATIATALAVSRDRQIFKAHQNESYFTAPHSTIKYSTKSSMYPYYPST
ncbi:hypothetical protein G6F38_005055 [Rhizopus arrhizus]|nr:hypothetical protein G6F38_005055 [Rhizopus arrhizus]